MALMSGLSAKADTTVPYLIFSGNADDERYIDLAKYNRITFGDNSMTVSSSTDGRIPPVELLYSLYNHFEVGNASPDVSGIDEISADTESQLIVDGQAKSLHITASESQTRFNVGVFDISGHLMVSTTLTPDKPLSIGHLYPGIYIAVATDGKTKLYVKFILD